MAGFITVTPSWAGKETLEYFIKPLLVGKNIYETKGFRILPNVKDKQKLNYFGATGKFTKAYAKGMSATNGVATYTQKDIEVVRLKSEAQEDGYEFIHTVFNQVTNSGLEMNNIENTELGTVVMELFKTGLAADIFRINWLGDTTKETISSGVFTGTADTDYNQMTGMLKRLRDLGATSPSYATQIKKVAMDHGAVKQKDTHTITGTSGTCNITVNGKLYLVTFASDLDTTAANFVTAHAAALLLRGVVVTSGTATIVLESARAGQPFTSSISAAVTGNLTGSKATSPANTAPAALTTDETISHMKSLMETCSPLLQAVPVTEKVFLMDYASYYNYIASLEGKATDRGNNILIDGEPVYKYRGVAIIPVEWDSYLTADFPTGYPNHIIYTEVNNLVLGIDGMGDDNKLESWFEKKDEVNYFRAIMNTGNQVLHNELTAIAF